MFSNVMTRSQAQLELSSSRDADNDRNNNFTKPVMAMLTAGPVSKTYHIGEEMEVQGRWGKVLLATDRETGEKRAVRRVKLGRKTNLDNVSKMVKQLLVPRHPNIVKYQGAALIPKELCLAMTLCNCSLTKVMPLSPKQLLFTCKEVVTGLAYLHKKGMVHGAVRASNVLLDKDGRARLGDWGLHTVIERDRVLQWEAPEVRRGEQVTKRSDVWSVGVLMVECALGKLPYQNYRLASPLSLLGQVKVLTDCYGLAKDCLNTVAEDRPDIEIVSNHKYLQGVKVDRLVGKEMLVGGKIIEKEDNLVSSAREKLDCCKCGELTGYSPVFKSEGGTTPFLCDNCVEVEGGHQDCDEKECLVCIEIGRALRQRWERQNNLDKLVDSKIEEMHLKNTRHDINIEESSGRSREKEEKDQMFDVLMEGVKLMQAMMMGEQGAEVKAGFERKCDVCRKLRMCLRMHGQRYCCMACMSSNTDTNMACSMCGNQFDLLSGKVSVNGNYFCHPCVAQLAKQAV